VGERSLLRRMYRAITLEADFYEEVEAEHASIRQATLIVLLVSLAGGLGTALRDVILGNEALWVATFWVVLDVVEPIVLWLIGSAFAYMVGATFFKGPETETDYMEVLRTTGFAFTPGLLRFFAWVKPPEFGFALTLVGDLWMLTCGVVAVRQALDFTTGRAIGTFGVAYGLMWLFLTALVLLPI
jgi:hypothetical protein